MKNILAAVITILSFTLVSLIASCSKPEKKECDGVMCTQELKLFSITTVTDMNTPIIPEVLRITDLQTGLALKTYTQNIGNNFVIFGDADMHLIPSTNTSYSVMVSAIKNNITTDSTIMSFSKDCCHVNITNGFTSLVVHQ